MTFSSELLYSVLIPALGGLAVGFPSGLVTGIVATLRWIERRRERGLKVPIYTEAENPTPGAVPWRGREHLSRLGWMLAILGVLGFIAGTVSVLQSNSTASCLRSYIERTSVVNQQRGEAAELDRRGLRQQIGVTREFNAALAEGITNPPPDQAQARADFLVKITEWDRRLAEVDRLFREAEQQRAANPIPAQPAC